MSIFLENPMVCPIHVFRDCPPNIGLPCPTHEEVAELKAAAQRGDVHWHAFPHNAELGKAERSVEACGRLHVLQNS